MSTFPIVKAPSPVLSEVCDPFTEEEIESGLARVLEKDLLDSIKTVQDNALGLAANQIGVNKRMFIMADRAAEIYRCFVNPIIVKEDKQIISRDEGCLSLIKPSVMMYLDMTVLKLGI